MFAFGKQNAARFVELATIGLLGAVLSQNAFADDFAPLTDAEFRTFAVEDLDLRMPLQGSSAAVEAGNAMTLRGYPLTQEELNLILDTSDPAFSRKAAGANVSNEHGKPPLRTRVVGWIKQRSSDFNFFKLFSADDSGPGVHLEVDTDEEELVLEYRFEF